MTELLVPRPGRPRTPRGSLRPRVLPRSDLSVRLADLGVDPPRRQPALARHRLALHLALRAARARRGSCAGSVAARERALEFHRVLDAARTAHGNDAVGRLYEAWVGASGTASRAPPRATWSTPSTLLRCWPPRVSRSTSPRRVRRLARRGHQDGDGPRSGTSGRRPRHADHQLGPTEREFLLRTGDLGRARRRRRPRAIRRALHSRGRAQLRGVQANQTSPPRPPRAAALRTRHRRRHSRAGYACWPTSDARQRP